MKKASLVLFFLLVGCSEFENSKFKNYEYFDEYQMKGVKEIKDLKSYEKAHFISIETIDDTIYVYKNDCINKGLLNFTSNHQKIKYIKQDRYWFTIEINKQEPEDNMNLINGYTFYKEKYIRNDSIIKFDYNRLLNHPFIASSISINTKVKEVFYSDFEFNFNNKNRIQLLNDICKENKNCEEYHKEIKGDVLLKYKKDPSDKYKKGCLLEATLLSSYGFFVEDTDESVIDKFYIDNKGTLPCE